jgi:hypothetical protein
MSQSKLLTGIALPIVLVFAPAPARAQQDRRLVVEAGRVAIEAVSQNTPGRPLVLLHSHEGDTTLAPEIANKLGLRTRSVADSRGCDQGIIPQCASGVGGDTVSVRLTIEGLSATHASFIVESWGSGPESRHFPGPVAFFKRTRLELTRQDGRWSVSKTEPLFTT